MLLYCCVLRCAHIDIVLIRYLINCGLLLTSEPGVFWFSVPGAGALIADIGKGRKEISKIIQKRKHKEILSKVCFVRVVVFVVDRV